MTIVLFAHVCVRACVCIVCVVYLCVCVVYVYVRCSVHSEVYMQHMKYPFGEVL